MSVGALVLTCEHGGNRVPVRYARLFQSRKAQAALNSHRGYDVGALSMARTLARRFRVPVIYSGVTRLLVEINRSVGHPSLFSEFARASTSNERKQILSRYYHPHRRLVNVAIRRHVQKGRRTLHVAVHSFASRLAGHPRTADIGLLYDPRREPERRFCARWKAELKDLHPDLRVRRNYPYRGRDDGLTTDLRQLFGPKEYLGIELETNQALLGGNVSQRIRVTGAIVESLSRLLG